jgi:hypothetical protein
MRLHLIPGQFSRIGVYMWISSFLDIKQHFSGVHLEGIVNLPARCRDVKRMHAYYGITSFGRTSLKNWSSQANFYILDIKRHISKIQKECIGRFLRSMDRWIYVVKEFPTMVQTCESDDNWWSYSRMTCEISVLGMGKSHYLHARWRSLRSDICRVNGILQNRKPLSMQVQWCYFHWHCWRIDRVIHKILVFPWNEVYNGQYCIIPTKGSLPVTCHWFIFKSL